MARKPNLLTCKTYDGLPLGRTFKTRNGAVVRHITKHPVWSCPVLVAVAASPTSYIKQGDVINLLWNTDPVAGDGGAFGRGWDITAEIKPPRATATKKRQTKKTNPKPARKAKKS